MHDGYVHPQALVDTEWVSAYGQEPNIRLVEVDVDTSAYDTGHIRGAVGWHWQRDLQRQPVLRVQAHRFSWRNTKKWCIKDIDFTQKAPPASAHLARCTRIRAIIGINVPTIWWHFSDGVNTVVQQLPVGIR